MKKSTAIRFCVFMLKYGIYCFPVFYCNQWMIQVNHPYAEWSFYEMTELWGLAFVDCAYNPHDYKTQDFGIYAKKGS